MDKFKERAEKYLVAPTGAEDKQKDINYNREELQRYLVMNTAQEFFYNEQDNTLYWFDKRKSPDKVLPQRLANFEVLIKRRYNLVNKYGEIVEMLLVTLRGSNSINPIDVNVPISNFITLMQDISKSNPEYRLYPDTRQQFVLSKQYLSEIYENVALRMPIEIVYENSGWNINELGMPHYYSGNDVNNCFSNFKLANNISYEPRDLME